MHIQKVLLCKSCYNQWYQWKKNRENPDLKEFLENGPRLHTSRWAREIETELVPGLVLYSDKMRKMADLVTRVATRNTSVLITGETGVGKELVALAIHKLSRRKESPFVTLDCTTLTPELAESELFGHEAGAFTGAVKKREGLFAAANTGTIFIDEISLLSLPLQVKLLRVLESGMFRLVGSTSYNETDVRLVSATNEPLKELVEKGRFRADLFYRLNVFGIEVPPLSEGLEGVLGLTRHLLARLGAPDVSLSSQAFLVLQRYSWPGNVRELEHALEHALVLHEGGKINVKDLPVDIVRKVTEQEVNLAHTIPSTR